MIEAATARADQETTTLPDDLKVIHGIGVSVEKRLNDAGIVTFAQLGEATLNEIAAVLKGMVGYTIERIRTQDWIGQARLLDKERNRQGNATAFSPTAISIDGDLEGLPPVRQPYAVFTIEFLLSEDRTVRRTHVLNVQSQQDAAWAGWDMGKLADFFARTSGLSLQDNEPATAVGVGEPAPAVKVAPASVKDDGTAPYRGRIVVTDWHIAEGERLLRHLVLTNRPFDLQLDIDLGETQFPPGEPLLCEVNLFASHERGGGHSAERITIGRGTETILLEMGGPEGAETITNSVRTVKVHGMLQDPGEYRIEAIVALRPANQPYSRKNQAAGLLEGILVRAYEGS